jgi:hypothetical protein
MSAATPLAAAKGLELVPSATSEHASETGFKATQSVQRFTPGPFRPQPVPTKKDNNYFCYGAFSGHSKLLDDGTLEQGWLEVRNPPRCSGKKKGQGQPGLSAAAAAAASAATARAAASATMRGSSAESGASGGGASGAEHGSRKRPAPPSPAAAQGLGSRKAKAGASSHEPIELSDGE